MFTLTGSICSNQLQWGFAGQWAYADSFRFLRDPGCRLWLATGELQSFTYLLQWLSMAIQMGNSSSVMGTPKLPGLQVIANVLLMHEQRLMCEIQLHQRSALTVGHRGRTLAGAQIWLPETQMMNRARASKLTPHLKYYPLLQ